MQTRSLPILLLICLALAGCSGYSAYPLYTAQDAVVEPAIEGAWISDREEGPEFYIKKSGEHEYNLTVADPDEKSVQTYEINLVRLGTQLYGDMIFSNEMVEGKRIGPAAGFVPMHVIARVEVTADRLSYAVLDMDALKKQNALDAAPLNLLLAPNAVVITDDTEALRRYVAIHGVQIFPDPEHLKRKKPSRP